MAGNFSGGDGEEPISAINVTPLVDVTLVLLIIFMVATPMIMRPSINVNLPKAKSGDQTAAGQITVTVTKDGTFFLNGHAATEDQIKEQARKLAVAKPDTQAVISADTATAHGVVIHILDVIKLSGIRRFALSTDKAN